MKAIEVAGRQIEGMCDLFSGGGKQKEKVVRDAIDAWNSRARGI